MKTQTCVWIDNAKAIIVTLKDDKSFVSVVDSEIEVSPTEGREQGSFMGSQHLSNERKLKERRNQQVESYLKRLIALLNETDELVVIGPSGMKIQLKKRIESDTKLASKLKGVHPAHSMTENQLVAEAKEIFSH